MHACRLADPDGCRVMSDTAGRLTVSKPVNEGWREVLRGRQEPSTRNDKTIGRFGEPQYQNERVETATLGSRAGRRLVYGVVAEEVGGVAVVLGNTSKLKARLGGPESGSRKRDAGIEGRDWEFRSFHNQDT